MRSSDIIRQFTKLLGNPQCPPLMLWGPPGIGKSDITRQVAENLNLPMLDIRAALLDAVDLRGIPTIKDFLAMWCPPSFWPRGGEGILFLDELPQAAPTVQGGLLQLILDKRLGEYVLPEGWRQVAAGNRAGDRAGANRMISPLKNRFGHFDLEVSNDDWQQWALTSGVAVEVRSYLNFCPGDLFEFSPGAEDNAFPTPRSWHKLSVALPDILDDLQHSSVSAFVGQAAGSKFVGYLKIFRELPDPDSVLASPDTSPVPRELAVLYALTGALVERMRTPKHDRMVAFCRYGQRLPSEFQVLALQQAVEVCQDEKKSRVMLRLPEAAKWIEVLRKKGLVLTDRR